MSTQKMNRLILDNIGSLTLDLVYALLAMIVVVSGSLLVVDIIGGGTGGGLSSVLGMIADMFSHPIKPV